ncbi:MAG: hypothetical protein RIA69_05885 [Cyclobacteriaceae bacterium]
MTKPLLFLLSICLIISCAAKKDNSTSKTTKLSLDELNIGKNQTGIVGKLKSVTPEGNSLKFEMSVEKSKQGGANSIAIGKGAITQIIATPIFLRQYKEKNESDLATLLKPEMEIMVLINQNMMTQQNNLVYISKIK